MKTLFTVCILFCLTTISFAAEQISAVNDGTVYTEDVTWRGTITVRGSVVVAPQATLRIEPGTMVRFTAPVSQPFPSLVVQGRIHAGGTAERPVILASERVKRGSWGGIVLLSTEKRNLLEHCRIEHAEIGIDVRFSTITLKAVSVTNAQTALLAHDGVIHLKGGVISDSETGIEAYNSELDVKDTTVASCKRGYVLRKSAVALATLKITNNQQTGLDADDCRLKISGAEFSANVQGARIKGGEGQIVQSRFLKNRQTALHLIASRIKIQRSVFADNSQDALRTEDGWPLILNNTFSGTAGFHLYNAGREVVNARQNWWGTADAGLIGQKIFDAARDKNSGIVHVAPWLKEKPQP